MKLISNSKLARFAGAATLWALTFAMPEAAQAQPDEANAAKAVNPNNRPPRPDRADLTPAQRLKERLRRQFQQAGVTETATQDKLLSYVESEVKARMALLEKARTLQTAVRGNALSDTQVAALLNTYQATVEEDRARRAKAEEELKKALDIGKMPKVEATLTLMGLYGDGRALLGNLLGGNGRGGQNGENAEGNGNAARPNRPRPNGGNQPEAPAGAAA